MIEGETPDDLTPEKIELRVFRKSPLGTRIGDNIINPLKATVWHRINQLSTELPCVLFFLQLDYSTMDLGLDWITSKSKNIRLNLLEI